MMYKLTVQFENETRELNLPDCVLISPSNRGDGTWSCEVDGDVIGTGSYLHACELAAMYHSA